MYDLTCSDLLHAAVFFDLASCLLQLVKVNDGTCQYEGIGESVFAIQYEVVLSLSQQLN